MSEDYDYSNAKGFVKKPNSKKNELDKTLSTEGYNKADIESLAGLYDLDTLDSEIADLKDTPDTDLYKGLMKTIRGTTKEKAGEVDVKVTIIGDDTANIKVSKGNKLLTERKVRFTQTSN